MNDEYDHLRESADAAVARVITYEQVTVMGRGRTLLRIESDTAAFLTGVEVNGDADPIAPRGADMRRHVIAKDQILRRVPLVVNRIYGTLEPKP